MYVSNRTLKLLMMAPLLAVDLHLILSLASLLFSENDSPVFSRVGTFAVSQQGKCKASIHSVDKERIIESCCARYPGSQMAVKLVLQTAAKRAIRSFEESGDSEQTLLSQLKQAESQQNARMA